MSDAIDHDRRRLLGTAAITVAALQMGKVTPTIASAGSRPMIPAITPGTHTVFAALKQITAGDLSVSYAEDGPADGQPVILLHGWPYDIHSFVDVAPLLASAGY